MTTSPACRSRVSRPTTNWPARRAGSILSPNTCRMMKCFRPSLCLLGRPEDLCDLIDHIQQFLAFRRLAVMLALTGLLSGFPELFMQVGIFFQMSRFEII